jgi:tetratricopeptide (TPR) repeat protein
MSTKDSDELWKQLFAAHAGNRIAELEQICATHRDTILANFAAWMKVPLEFRDQRDKVDAFAEAMLAVALIFQHRLSRPELMNRLQGGDEPNALTHWQQTLTQAMQEMQELRYREAALLLTDLLIDARSLSGSGVDYLLPRTYGYLGECYFQGGDAERAVSPTERALALCKKSAEAEGIRAYLGNLYEIHRYRGDGPTAAAYAEQLADVLDAAGKANDARRYRKLVSLVRAGEPKNRVVVGIEGQRYEVAEVLEGIEGSVQFFFERNRLTLHPASTLTEQGEQFAGKGQFYEALDLFREAARADQYAPQPMYQAALTLLYLERADEAVDAYTQTEDLAPGWFHCRSALWLAEQIEIGKVSYETFRHWHLVEEGPLTPTQKVQMARKALDADTDLALFYHPLGKNLLALGQTAEAEAAYRRGLAIAEEPDLKTRLLADLGVMVLGAAEKRRLLQRAIDLNGNLVAAAMAAVVLAFQ